MTSPEIRFWRYVHEGAPEDCWPWLGAKNARGYGVLQGTAGTRLAHRVSYEMAYGPIPAGAVIRHQCHTADCVNPTHMLTGSRAENVQDSVRVNRHARELDFPYTKLSDAQVRELRATYAAGGATRQTLARKYDLHPVYVGKILTRRARVGADDMTR